MLVTADVVGAGNLVLLAGERWFLARTLPHREVTAETNLRRQGFRSFLPRHLRTVRHARKCARSLRRLSRVICLLY
jgi:hypothetical protein